MPTLKAKHIRNSRKATTPPKIAKEYILPPTHFRTNINPRKTKQYAESQWLTMYKKNRTISFPIETIRFFVMSPNF
jgi:hypothetical protein